MNWYSRNASLVDLAFFRNSLTIMEINGKTKIHYWNFGFLKSLNGVPFMEINFRGINLSELLH